MGVWRPLAALLAALALGSTAAGPSLAAPPKPAEWRTVEAENLWVIETGKGRVLIELRADIAPNHVARIRQLTRAGYYDGALFYRVIDHYFVQGGDRSVTGTFTSDLPNLTAEFTIPGLATTVEWLGSNPIKREEDGTTYARFCAGTAAFPHYDDPDTANSQIFIMREAGQSMERKYTPFGRVVSGLEVVRAINVGQPPAEPDQMVRVRVAADIPEAERPVVEVADTTSAAFRKEIDTVRKQRDKARLPFSLCDVPVPSRVR